MALVIRRSVEADLPSLLAIYNYEIENGVATFDLEPLTLEERRPWLESHNVGNHPLLTAELDGVPSGYASLSAFASKRAYAGTVELSVYVSPKARGRGIGRKLVEEVLRLAREDPSTHLVVSVITAGNAASTALHRKFGFAHVGTLHEAGFKKGRWLDVDLWELKV